MPSTTTDRWKGALGAGVCARAGRGLRVVLIAGLGVGLGSSVVAWLGACAQPDSGTAPSRASSTAVSQRPAASSARARTDLPANPMGAFGLAEADYTPKVEDWTFEGTPEVPGKALTTRSFRIMTTSTSQGLKNRLPIFMETALRHYTSAIVDLPAPEGAPLNLYMMANRPQWERLTQRVMGDDAGVYLRIERGGFTARGSSILWDIGWRDTYSIAAHEGWHLYTQRVFRDPLPVGLEEGIATYMEGFRWNSNDESTPRFLPWANGERFWQLRQAASAQRLVAIDELLLLSPQDLMSRSTQGALDYYAQVWALVHFLMEADSGRYRPALEGMLTDAASGALSGKIREKLGPRAASIHVNRRRGVDVLSVYTGVESRALDTQYKDFVDRIVRSGTWQRVWRGDSPLE